MSQLDDLVDDVRALVGKYVVMSKTELLVVALWIIHTHVIRYVEQTPYLAVTSPEKQCGKSRLLEVIELLVAKPWSTILPSEAVVFRTVDQNVPTMLLDETDAIFNPKNADRYEGLRAILNNGHRRGARVPRCIGQSGRIQEFSTFCPKVLAGIGTVPETVADRSLPIRLQRKTKDEEVARFRRRTAKLDADALRERIEAWASEFGEALEGAEPDMPDELSDRMQEGCECLVAIADALGCGADVRDALVDLLSGERLDDQETMRLRLLRDLRPIFDEKPKARAVFTETILGRLWDIDDAPWPNYYGRPIEARDLASLLKPYGVKPTTVRSRNGSKPKKGYRRDDLVPVWERYS